MAGNPSRGPGPRPSSDRPVLSSARPEGRNTRLLGCQALALACQSVSKSPFRPPGRGRVQRLWHGPHSEHKEGLSARLLEPGRTSPQLRVESLPSE